MNVGRGTAVDDGGVSTVRDRCLATWRSKHGYQGCDRKGDKRNSRRGDHDRSTRSDERAEESLQKIVRHRQKQDYKTTYRRRIRNHA